MSLVTMYESSVRRKRDEISRLKTDRVKYVNIVNNCSKKILTATKQANSCSMWPPTMSASRPSAGSTAWTW